LFPTFLQKIDAISHDGIHESMHSYRELGGYIQNDIFKN
jgi:hypothetical protein